MIDLKEFEMFFYVMIWNTYNQYVLDFVYYYLIIVPNSWR